MAKLGNRVKESSQSIGTGPLVLDGAPQGWNRFNEEFASGDDPYYVVVHLDALDNVIDYEYGVAIFNIGTPDTLTRSAEGVIGSSNGGNLVNFQVGSKTVINTLVAGKDGGISELLVKAIGGTAARTLAAWMADLVGAQGDIATAQADIVELQNRKVDRLPGTPLQTVAATPYIANEDLTAQIPVDSTPPRSSEGTRIQSVSIDVTRANSRLLVEWDGQVSADVVPTYVAAALFMDDDLACRAARWATCEVANRFDGLGLSTIMIPGSAGVHEVSVNVGPQANTIRLNGTPLGPFGIYASQAQLRVTELAGEVITWGGGQDPTSPPTAAYLESQPQNGDLSTEAPGLTNYTVGAPSGAAPTEGDLASHRYRHHTAVAEHNGRVWVANSSAGTNEGAGGQMTVVANSLTGVVSFSAPILVIPPQSAFSGTGAALVPGTRVTYPSCFAKHGGKLYLIGAIDEFSATGALGDTIGIALVARECNDDGTVGPLFRISTEAYTPASGVSAIAYDPVLGPPLLAIAKLYGQWGGSHPDETQVSWTMWAKQGSAIYAEPTTIDVNGDGTYMIRLWRRLTAPDHHFWVQYSEDGGATWSAIRETDIPNAPSTAFALRLADGRIALVGNMNSDRDPLYLALFDGPELVRSDLYYVRQGVPTEPTYPGEYKGGGASYASLYLGATDLWVSYSIAKETIGVTRIPLAGL